MSVAKKIGPLFDDQINAKIQRKFDMVFNEKSAASVGFSNEKNKNELGDPQNFDVDEMVMERNDGSNKKNNTKPKIDLDLAGDEQAPVIPEKKSGANTKSKEDDTIGFSLDFDLDLINKKAATRTGVTIAAVLNEEDQGDLLLMIAILETWILKKMPLKKRCCLMQRC